MLVLKHCIYGLNLLHVYFTIFILLTIQCVIFLSCMYTYSHYVIQSEDFFQSRTFKPVHAELEHTINY